MTLGSNISDAVGRLMEAASIRAQGGGDTVAARWDEVEDAITALENELAFTQRNREMWKDQCGQQAAELTKVRMAARTAFDTLPDDYETN